MVKKSGNTVEGVLFKIGHANANGDVYTEELAEKLQKQLEEARGTGNPILGGFFDPTYTRIEQETPLGTLPIDKIGISLRSLSKQGDELHAKIDILETPVGKNISKLLDVVPEDYSISGMFTASDEDVRDKKGVRVVKNAKLERVSIIKAKDKA